MMKPTSTPHTEAMTYAMSAVNAVTPTEPQNALGADQLAERTDDGERRRKKQRVDRVRRR